MPRRNIAKEIEAGLRGIIADLDGTGPELKTRVIAVPDVRQIRQGLGLSQSQFSARFGLNPRTVQEWEQKRRQPDQLAAVLLNVIEKEPKAVERSLQPFVQKFRPAHTPLGRISRAGGVAAAAKRKAAKKA